MKGPKCKPVKLKIAGTVGESLAIRNPPPPKHLGKIAAAKWRSIMPILSQLGTLAESDLTLVEMFCACYGRWREAESKVESMGGMVLAVKGGSYESPWVSLAKRFIEISIKLTQELGLSPTARAKIMGTPRGTGKRIVRRVR
jgi:P27 family predicted phage terminase small subunit